MQMQVLKRRYFTGMKSHRVSASDMSPKLRRACEECTRSKVRCSGTSPCLLCVKRSCKCVYQPRRKRQKKSLALKRKYSQTRSKAEKRGIQAEMAYRPAKATKSAHHSFQRNAGIGSAFSSKNTKNDGKDEVVKDVSKTLVGLNQTITSALPSASLPQVPGSSHPSMKLQHTNVGMPTTCPVPPAYFSQRGSLNPESVAAYATLIQSGHLEKQMLLVMKDMQIGQLRSELTTSRQEVEKLLKEKFMLQEENKQLKQLKVGQKLVYSEAGKENVKLMSV